MAEEIGNLILEQLKRFQVGQDRIERKLEEVVTRLGSLDVSVASVRRDFVHNQREHINHQCARGSSE